MKSPPSGTFKGRNFMTPEFVDYYTDGDDVWVEVSAGQGMGSDVLYGITIHHGGGGDVKGHASHVVFSAAEAAEAVNDICGTDLSAEDVRWEYDR